MAKRKGMIGHNPLAWLSDADDSPKKAGTKKDKPKKSAGKKSKASATGKKTAPKKKIVAKKSAVKKPVAKKDTKVKTVNKKKPAAASDTVSKARVIELSSVQAISQVAEQHKQWMEILNSESVIKIDASQVTSIDAASLQLIYALWKEANKLDIDISWQGHSDALLDAARLLGLESSLQLNKAA